VARIRAYEPVGRFEIIEVSKEEHLAVRIELESGAGYHAPAAQRLISQDQNHPTALMCRCLRSCTHPQNNSLRHLLQHKKIQFIYGKQGTRAENQFCVGCGTALGAIEGAGG